MFEAMIGAAPVLDSAADPLAEFHEPVGRLVTSHAKVLLEQLRRIASARGEYEQLFLDAYRSTWWKAAWPVRRAERWLRRRRNRCP
jgi:hypothetical protein